MPHPPMDMIVCVDCGKHTPWEWSVPAAPSPIPPAGTVVENARYHCRFCCNVWRIRNLGRQQQQRGIVMSTVMELLDAAICVMMREQERRLAEHLRGAWAAEMDDDDNGDDGVDDGDEETQSCGSHSPRFLPP